MTLYNFSYIPHGRAVPQVDQDLSDNIHGHAAAPVGLSHFVRAFDTPSGWGPAGRRAADRETRPTVEPIQNGNAVRASSSSCREPGSRSAPETRLSRSD
jgi:hypothetical protein